MANGVFTRADTFLNDFLTTLTTQAQTLLSSKITTLIGASITLYIVVYGYLVLVGKIQDPIRDIVFNLAKFAIIIAFIKNEGGYLTMFSEAVKELSTLGGNVSVLGSLDGLMETMSKFSARVADDGSWSDEWLLALIIWIGFILMAIPIALTYVISKLILYFLLGLSPIFFFMLMWNFLKDSFASFMSAIISNALVLTCVGLMINSVTQFLLNNTNLDGNPYLVAVSFAIVGLISGVLIKQMVGAVNVLSRVSIEKAGAGAVNAFKQAKDTMKAPLTPTQNETSIAAQKAAKSQVDTQVALQNLAKEISENFKK